MHDHGNDGHNLLPASSYNWIPNFVYGGIDGAITTFAVVAGVEGASLSITVLLILGFANLIADGFSMSIGKYLSDKSNLDVYDRVKSIEYEHLNTKTHHETLEVKHILSNYGFKDKNLDNAVEVFTSNPDAWVDLMMRNEFDMTKENISPIKGAATTFISFIVIGFIPLIGYVFGPVLNFTPEQSFIATCAATTAALFIVGAVKSIFSPKHWIISGLETVGIGGIAAILAYSVGFFLKTII